MSSIKINRMGSVLHAAGVSFRVWAPHALKVSVVGTFNEWDASRHPMESEDCGCWSLEVPEAKAGDQYRYLLTTAGGEVSRIDPYAREVTSSMGNAIVHDPTFDWEGDHFVSERAAK